MKWALMAMVMLASCARKIEMESCSMSVDTFSFNASAASEMRSYRYCGYVRDIDVELVKWSPPDSGGTQHKIATARIRSKAQACEIDTAKASAEVSEQQAVRREDARQQTKKKKTVDGVWSYAMIVLVIAAIVAIRKRIK